MMKSRILRRPARTLLLSILVCESPAESEARGRSLEVERASG